MEYYLQQEFEQETRTRMQFNEQHHRYLPQNLKYLLEEPPTRYTIYPKDRYLNENLDYEESLKGIDPHKMLDFIEGLNLNKEEKSGDEEVQEI